MIAKDVLNYIKETYQKSIEAILTEMLEIPANSENVQDVKVKNWNPLAAIQAYMELPIGFDTVKTDEKIYEERRMLDQIIEKRDQVLSELKSKGIFANWTLINTLGDDAGGTFKAVTVFNKDSKQSLIGRAGEHYAFRSENDARAYAHSFHKFYFELMKASAKKGIPRRIKISMEVIEKRAIDISETNVS